MNEDEDDDFKVVDMNVEKNKAETSQLKQTNKEFHEPLDPTRYGDWEKNGRCIDF